MSAHRFEGFTPVSSDHIDGAKHDAMDGVMHVRFKNGYVYAVHGVSAEDYRAFMDAKSQGEHYHSRIKDQYHIERIR